MNLQTILHLLKARWRHQRIAVIAVWALLLLMALPWLLHDPASFSNPYPLRSGGSGDTVQLVQSLDGPQRLGWIAMLLNPAWLVIFCLSAAIGLHATRGTDTLPIRRTEAALAELLALFLFIAAPSMLLIAAALALHGLPVGLIATGVTLAGISILLIHLVSARFAAWCGSFWLWLTGVAGVLALLQFGYLQWTGVGPYLQTPYRMLDLWGNGAGPKQWAFLILTLAFLTVAGPLLRNRLKPFSRVACGVFLIALASALAARFDDVSYQPQAKTIDLKPEPVAGSGRIAHYRGRLDRRLESQIGASAIFDASPEVPGSLVRWHAEGDTKIRQGDRALGSLSLDQDPSRRLTAKLPPQLMLRTDEFPGLPGNGVASRSLSERKRETEFGTTLLDHGELQGNEPLTFETPVVGQVYRYETVVDVELTDSPAAVRAGDTTFHVRRILPQRYDHVLADVTMSHASFGWARTPEHLNGNLSTLDLYRVFLFFPSNGLNYPVETLYQSSGPILSGAGRDRRVYGIQRNLGLSGDRLPSADGARLIVLKPVLTGITPVSRVTVQASPEKEATPERDYRSNRIYAPRPAEYLDIIASERPDPATCDRRQFGKWLRTASSVQILDLTERDLAAFAPRFSPVLARASFAAPAAGAILQGTPEAGKRDVLAAFGAVGSPWHLLNTLARRGWLDDVRQEAVRRFQQGDLNLAEVCQNVPQIASLEDPATYPALLAGYMNPEHYEILRQLPGIEPALTEALRKKHAAANPSRDAAMGNDLPPIVIQSAYAIPARHGIPEAFTDLMRLWKGSPTQPGRHYQAMKTAIQIPGGLEDSPRTWAAYLKDKEASDFTYDPLARRWILRNPQP